MSKVCVYRGKLEGEHNGLEKTIMQGIVAEKKAGESQDRYGRKMSGYVWYDLSSKPSSRINFAETSGSDAPKGIRSEKKNLRILYLNLPPHYNTLMQC